MLGRRFDPLPAHWVKDLVLLQLRLGSDPWLRNSICPGAAKIGKKVHTLLSEPRFSLRPTPGGVIVSQVSCPPLARGGYLTQAEPVSLLSVGT